MKKAKIVTMEVLTGLDSSYYNSASNGARLSLCGLEQGQKLGLEAGNTKFR
jgi:hypothetical protein